MAAEVDQDRRLSSVTDRLLRDYAPLFGAGSIVSLVELCVQRLARYGLARPELVDRLARDAIRQRMARLAAGT